MPATAPASSLMRLRNAGIKAALDDFGVGYSSLSHLRDLPMHRLKIDRSFTVDCMRDARTLTIVKSVIDMAHNLGLHVTAEGIETAEQQAWMQHLGCDSAQGYYFARPMPAEEFLQRFLERRAQQRRRPQPRRRSGGKTDAMNQQADLFSPPPAEPDETPDAGAASPSAPISITRSRSSRAARCPTSATARSRCSAASCTR